MGDLKRDMEQPIPAGNAESHETERGDTVVNGDTAGDFANKNQDNDSADDNAAQIAEDADAGTATSGDNTDESAE